MKPGTSLSEQLSITQKDFFVMEKRGSIMMGVPFPHALLIPQKATYEILDKKYVFVVDDQNTVHAREITIEARNGRHFCSARRTSTK